MTGKAKAGGSLVATLIGGIAVLLWSTLALLTVEADGLPRFQLLAMTFGIAFFCSLLVMLRRGLKGLNVLQQSWPAWVLGVAALFLYHAVYFYALDEAPAAEAQMITFLWPLLIVLFSALAPGGRLRWFHLIGALLGFLGAGLLVGGGELGFKAEFWVGYLLAALCALIWSSYSVVNRRFAQVPSETVGGFCGLVAVIGCFLHLTLEKTVVPDGGQWLAVLALGVGPVGLAFFVWDYGTKHGSLPALGAFSYAAPLISTLLLIAFGHAEMSWLVLASAALVVAGALLAAQDLLFAEAKP